jgi:hypothetical protein
MHDRECEYKMGRVQESSSVVGPAHTRTYWFLMVGVLLLLLWPVLDFEYPTMVDYPSHLARVKILRDLNREPVLQQRYEIIPRAFPNLALELLGVYVFSWLSVPEAGKAALALLMILFWGGCHLLGCATGQGRPVWLASAAALLAYNSTFLYGFFNYNFGIALFLLALSTWLWYRRKRSFLRLLATTGLATATYLAHLIGVGTLAVAIVFLTTAEWWRGKRWRKELVLDLLPLGPSALLYASLGRYRGDTSSVVWGSLALKAKHMMVCLTTYSARLTILYSITCLVALAIIVFKGRWSARSSLLSLGGVLLLLAVVFPAKQLFDGSDADARLVVPAFAVTLLTVVVTMPRFWARTAFILVLGAMCARVIEIHRVWKAGDALTRTQIELFRSVPKGARVFPVVWLPSDIEANKRERHVWHAIEYATVDNSVFFPQLINAKGTEPLMLRNTSYNWVAPGMRAGVVSWENISRDYDFIYSYGVDQTFQRYLDGHYNQIGVSGKGRMYRIPEWSQ